MALSCLHSVFCYLVSSELQTFASVNVLENSEMRCETQVFTCVSVVHGTKAENIILSSKPFIQFKQNCENRL